MLTHIKRIFKNSSGFALGSILTNAVGFILLPIYTRYLTPDDYGILSIATAIGSILGILYLAGLNGAIGRFYYDYNDDESELKKYIGTIVLSLILYSLCFTIFLSIFGNLIFQSMVGNLQFNPYILIILWTTFFSTIFPLSLIMYQVREKPLLYSFWSIIKFIVNTLLIIYFVVGLRQGALGSLIGSFITSMIFFVVGYILLKKDISLIIERQKLIESLKFGIPLIPHALAGWTLTLIDRIFLNNYQSIAIVGLYSLGYQFGMIMSLITTSINFAWTPFFMSTAKEKGEDAKPIFKQLTTYYMMVIIFIGLVISMFAKDVIFLMTTPEYYKSYEIIPIIVGSHVLNGMYYMVVNQIFYTKKTKYLPIATFGSALINIALNYLWIPNYGMMGAAYATLFSFAFAFIFTWIISYKVYPIHYEYQRIVKIIGAACIVSIISFNVSYANLLSDIAIKLIILMFFPISLIISGVITKSELNKCYNLIKNCINKYSEKQY